MEIGGNGEFHGEFHGEFDYSTNGKGYRGRPLFNGSERVIAFDVEQVLVMQKGQYRLGRRRGFDNYKLHRQAKKVVGRALADFDKVVLWSTSHKVLDFSGLERPPFSEVQQRIWGHGVRDFTVFKNLRMLSHDPHLMNVVALEDCQATFDPYFDPLQRVFLVGKHDDLMKRYEAARELVFQ